MGFIRANMLPILKDHARRPFSGHLLCLGHPDVYFNQAHLQRMAVVSRVPLNLSAPPRLSEKPDLARKQYLSGDYLFKCVGFARISTMDISAYENAQYIFDLNSPSSPQELIGAFDCIIDHGTLEHVFHVPHALSNIFRMCKEGGRVIHSSPGSNFFDHGFHMFSPTLFCDYYSANEWEINTMQVVQFTPNQEHEPPFFADYEPGLFDCYSYGGLDSKMYATVSIVTKTAKSTSTRIPVQGFYARQRAWQAKR